MPARAAFLLQGLAGGLLHWVQGWTCSVGYDPPGLAKRGQDLGGSLEWQLGHFHGCVCMCPKPQPPWPPPEWACSLAPAPQLWALSEAPLFAAWSGKSHPGPVNHPGVTRSDFRPWKEMAAFFHCRTDRVSDQRRGHGVPTLATTNKGISEWSQVRPEAELSSWWGQAHSGDLGCPVKESADMSRPDHGSWLALESALQMWWMSSDFCLDAPISRTEEMPRGSVQASAALAPSGSHTPKTFFLPVSLRALTSCSTRRG